MSPIDLPTDPVTTASAAAVLPAMPAIAPAMDAAKPKAAEFGLKGGLNPKLQPEVDDTDNDIDYIYELAKLAIGNGVSIKEVDLMALIPYFEQQKKQNTKKYTAQKIMGFFTGGTFMFLVYLLLDKIG